MSAVIEGLQKEHGLLAAYLEATAKIDWPALHNQVSIVEVPKPVDLEMHHASTAPMLPRAFAFRRANLARASE